MQQESNWKAEEEAEREGCWILVKEQETFRAASSFQEDGSWSLDKCGRREGWPERRKAMGGRWRGHFQVVVSEQMQLP